jgi:hypothetical protein
VTRTDLSDEAGQLAKRRAGGFDPEQFDVDEANRRRDLAVRR